MATRRTPTLAADKPVAEKVSTSPQAPADENLLVMPAGWMRSLLPRRGGARVTVKRPAKAAEKVAEVLDAYRKAITDSLAAPRLDEEIAAAGTAYLAGDPGSTPLGAAVVATLVSSQLNWEDKKTLAAFADTWLADRGLVFAAVAVAELCSLRADNRNPVSTTVPSMPPIRRLLPMEDPTHWTGWWRAELPARVRAEVAAATPAQYAEVVAALAECREHGPHHRVGASFLVPTEIDWVDADCAEAVRVNPRLADGLLHAASTMAQVELIKGHLLQFYVVNNLIRVVTVVDGLGHRAAAPLVAEWLDGARDPDDRKRMLGVLAALPGDEAMRLLLDRIDHRHAQPAVLEAAGRFPRRAMRLLADHPGGKTVDELLRAHVLSHLELVDEVLAGLTGPAADRIGAVVADSAAVVTAPPEALPPVLADPPWTRRRAADPLDALPAKTPVLPDWADPGLLTPIQVRDGAGALPAQAARHVLTMLAMSRLGEPYAGIALVTAACDSRSLAEFGWSLFLRWQAVGHPAKESWVMGSLALLGDDETVRRLSPVIRAWPGEGGHTRAVAGLEVLAAIGSDVALTHLHGIAEKVRFAGLRDRARKKMADVAAQLGLTPEQLADRLVPDFGLAADGSLALDYGRRQFIVGFDEQLKPYVSGAGGKRRKEPPKPGAADDPELAPAAYQRFAGLKKDVRTVAADQIRRLEQAMVTRRRWSGEEFSRLLVGHPLLWHIVRRLVWGSYDETGALVGALRVAEDRSFADVADDAFVLPEGALVGVAHPLELAGALSAWAQVFAGHEILQPFAQLSQACPAGPLPAAGD